MLISYCVFVIVANIICRKLGRAMLRPIFDQKTRRDGHMSPELRRALIWWVEILQSKLCERRLWKGPQLEPVHLFCDASGSPALLGAVLITGDRCCYTHYTPPAELVNGFRRRRDNQIMGLELLAISLGLCTFADMIRGRNVVIHCDNTGAEAAIRRGSAVSLDHAQLVHTQWTHAAEQGLCLHVLRVSTHDNIADLPSRGAFRMLELAGAELFEPILQSQYWDTNTWEALHECWRL